MSLLLQSHPSYVLVQAVCLMVPLMSPISQSGLGPQLLLLDWGWDIKMTLWLQTILRFEITYAFVQLNAEFQTKELGGCVTQLAGS